MPTLAWATDLHLEFADDEAVESFLDAVRDAQPDALLVGGDISNSKRFDCDLERLAEIAPVHFVLGNHDYYGSSIESVRSRARLLSRSSSEICWLADEGVVPVSPGTALVGHGGWGDARLGCFETSNVVLNDYLLIEELRVALGARDGQRFVETPLPGSLRAALNELGAEAAAHFEKILPGALEEFRHVLVLMHVPPFHEACWHEGRTSDDNWAPHFTCGAVGDVLRSKMESRPDRRMTVLCGHTHGSGTATILPNLQALTGGATYGRPELQRTLVIE